MNDTRPPNVPPANVLPPDAPGLRALTSLVAGIAVIGALYFGREVLIPVMLAVLLSFLVEPFVEFLRRFKLGQIPSVIVAVLVALGFVRLAL
jgi:predicted PurR-regulated permease PerM